MVGGGGGGVVGAPAPPRSLILQKCVLWGKKDPEATLLLMEHFHFSD